MAKYFHPRSRIDTRDRRRVGRVFRGRFSGKRKKEKRKAGRGNEREKRRERERKKGDGKKRRKKEGKEKEERSTTNRLVGIERGILRRIRGVGGDGGKKASDSEKEAGWGCVGSV